jgi:ATP-dependent DNA helicase DinG
MNISQRLTAETAEYLRSQIEDAEGQEVLFVGSVGEEGLVEGVTATARGHDSAAPALFPFMEKGDVVIHNHPSGVLSPSDADLQIATRLGNQGIGFYLVNNEVSRVYCVSEPVSGGAEEEMDPDELAAYLEPGGAMETNFEGYEAREEQVRMLRSVVRAFNERRIAAVEAGTGVGKSLAYLLPAAWWAHRNRERVIVSTATINLQQQLLEKDIPLAEKILGVSIGAKLVKGRGNYLCLRRMEDAFEEMALFRQPGGELETIREWASQTATGDRSDLAFYPSGEVWAKVCSEADACMGLKCPHREQCFVLKARKQAAASNLLLVNHHLLFADLAARKDGAGYEGVAVLPPAKRIIFDEAHAVEKSATGFFSTRYNKLMLFKQLRRLYFPRTKSSGGLAVTVQKYSGKPELFEYIPEKVQKLYDAAEELDGALVGFLQGENTYRITGETKEELADIFAGPLTNVKQALTVLLTDLEQALSTVKEEHADESEVFEAGVVLERLGVLHSVLSRIEAVEEEEENIYWMERRAAGGRDPYVTLIATPLEIAELMREAVFEPNKTVIATSATLTVKKEFTFWLSRVGLLPYRENGLLTDRVESPFSYRERVMLAVPEDAPEPRQLEYQEYVSSFAAEALDISEGSGLVLFTSYGMLQKTYEAVAPKLEQRGIRALKQGTDDRSRLLTAFHRDVSSVLFATDSFWEGVDAPGESLKVVLICRLPFGVPTDPVIKARMEAIEQRGGNSFMEYALPQAAMKLRQGFGRLMRRKSDRGIVCILDSRIIRKSYGGVLLETLPDTEVRRKGKEELLREFEDFLWSRDAQ